MKVCELGFAILFSFCLSGVHGGLGYSGKEIQRVRAESEARSVDNEEELHVNDPKVVNLATFVIDQLNNQKRKNDNPLHLTEIVKASTKETAGNATFLTLKVSQGGVSDRCEFKIINGQGSNKIQMVHPRCGTIPATNKKLEGDNNKRYSRDGDKAEELDVNNAEVVRLSRMALVEINKKTSKRSEPNRLLEIVKATVTPVSGKKTELSVVMKASQGRTRKTCKVTIQQQVWLNKTKIKEAECKNDETITKTRNENNEDITEDAVSDDTPTELGFEKEDDIDTFGQGGIYEGAGVTDEDVKNFTMMALSELNFQKQENDPPFNLSKVVEKMPIPPEDILLIIEVLQGSTKDTCKFFFRGNFVEDQMIKITHSKCGTVPASIEDESADNEDESVDNKDEEVDLDDPETIPLIKLALIHLDESSNEGDDPINLSDIVKIIKQETDSGKLVSLTLKVSQEDDMKICDFKLSEKSDVWQVTESKCETINNEETTTVDYQATEGSDDQYTAPNLPPETDAYSETPPKNDQEPEGIDVIENEGELDVNDPEVVQLSTLGMITLNDEKLREHDPLVLLEIVEATTDVNSGNITLIKLKVTQGEKEHLCLMEFMPTPDLAVIKVKHSACGTVGAKYTANSFDTLDLSNGVKKLPLDNTEVVRLSMITLVKLYEQNPTKYPVNLLKIVKAARQLVTGSLYILTLQVSQGDEKKECDVQIIENPWLNTAYMKKSDCHKLKDENYDYAPEKRLSTKRRSS